MNKYKQKAFTLIELLVVIAIIGLLASIVLVALNNARTKGRDAKRKGDLHAISTALELYYNSNNSFPAGSCISSWSCWSLSSLGPGSVLVGGNLVPTYLGSINADPTNHDDGTACNTGDSGSFLYSYDSDGQHYVVATRLESPSSKDINYTTPVPGSCSGFANYAVKDGF